MSSPPEACDRTARASSLQNLLSPCSLPNELLSAIHAIDVGDDRRSDAEKRRGYVDTLNRHLVEANRCLQVACAWIKNWKTVDEHEQATAGNCPNGQHHYRVVPSSESVLVNLVLGAAVFTVDEVWMLPWRTKETRSSARHLMVLLAAASAVVPWSVSVAYETQQQDRLQVDRMADTCECQLVRTLLQPLAKVLRTQMGTSTHSKKTNFDGHSADWRALIVPPYLVEWVVVRSGATDLTSEFDHGGNVLPMMMMLMDDAVISPNKILGAKCLQHAVRTLPAACLREHELILFRALEGCLSHRSGSEGALTDWVAALLEICVPTYVELTMVLFPRPADSIWINAEKEDDLEHMLASSARQPQFVPRDGPTSAVTSTSRAEAAKPRMTKQGRGGGGKQMEITDTFYQDPGYLPRRHLLVHVLGQLEYASLTDQQAVDKVPVTFAYLRELPRLLVLTGGECTPFLATLIRTLLLFAKSANHALRLLALDALFVVVEVCPRRAIHLSAGQMWTGLVGVYMSTMTPNFFMDASFSSFSTFLSCSVSSLEDPLQPHAWVEQGAAGQLAGESRGGNRGDGGVNGVGRAMLEAERRGSLMREIKDTRVRIAGVMATLLHHIGGALVKGSVDLGGSVSEKVNSTSTFRMFLLGLLRKVDALDHLRKELSTE